VLLEKLGVTVGALTLGTAWVGGLVWVHGDARPASDASAVGRPTRVAVTPGVHGYGNATSRPSPTASPRSTPAPGRTKRAKQARTPAQPPAQSPAPVTAPAPLAPIGEGSTYAGEYPGVEAPVPDTPAPESGPVAGSGGVAEFSLATFNVLGSSHTEKGGHHAWLASGPERVGGVLQILDQHDISVVGLQEFQRNQRTTFASRARGWQMYPTLSMPARDGENTVAWRTDTWDLVRPATVAIPYFNGRTRQMPYVLLRHKETGVQAYFSTFHNPADTRRFRGQQRFRNAATERQIDLFNRLDREGVPQFVTGDMNERAEYFCKVTARTRLVAAAGGSNSGSCRPPRPTMIDWIFGSRGVGFSSYRVDRGPLVRRTTDHPVVVTRASVDAGRFANAAGSRG
jgi:hypothetical protein